MAIDARLRLVEKLNDQYISEAISGDMQGKFLYVFKNGDCIWSQDKVEDENIFMIFDVTENFKSSCPIKTPEYGFFADEENKEFLNYVPETLFSGDDLNYILGQIMLFQHIVTFDKRNLNFESFIDCLDKSIILRPYFDSSKLFNNFVNDDQIEFNNFKEMTSEDNYFNEMNLIIEHLRRLWIFIEGI